MKRCNLVSVVRREAMDWFIGLEIAWSVGLCVLIGLYIRMWVEHRRFERWFAEEWGRDGKDN